jgi:SOS-response transcriptional repressor LexA
MKGIFTMERQLTDKQMHTLRFIHDYIKSNDCAPTRKEIAEALGISTNAAYGRVHCLFIRDYLREPETWDCGRSIALTEKGIRVCEGLSEE